MKLRALVVLIACLLSACGNFMDPSPAAAASTSGAPALSPAIGMSKSQIRDIYGEPDSVDRSPCCEAWNYWFHGARVFIPGRVHTRARNALFIFGNNGLVKDFAYNQ